MLVVVCPWRSYFFFLEVARRSYLVIGHRHLFRLCLVGVKIGRMEKKERKTWKKIKFSFVWFRRENTNDGKHWGKNPPGPKNFYPPNLGGKLGRKERKGGLSS